MPNRPSALRLTRHPLSRLPERDGVDATFAVEHVHRIRFTRNAFDPANTVLRDLFVPVDEHDAATGRAIVFIDDGVAAAWPDLADRVEHYARAHADVMTLARPPIVVTGGERAKSDASVFDAVTEMIERAGICRHSFVIAIGGGAMLDAVGYGAAAAHRGVRLVRFPTTTLSQCDSGIGVKSGINAFGKKNFLGHFDVPWAVVNDESFLATLSDRDWRSGLSEAVKVGLLKDVDLFDRIRKLAPHLAVRDEAAVVPLLRRSAELHLEHIVAGGDPFELRNARPLDFGHWSAHRLEQLSAFRLRHGEAVSIGIALDVIYAATIGLLEWEAADAVVTCLTDLGLPVYDELLREPGPVLEGIQEFREHLGGRLTITLLAGAGRPVDVHEIDVDAMVESMRRLEERAAERAA